VEKTLNIVIYKPGYGGHFIEFIMSLDPSTVCWLPVGHSRYGEHITDIAERVTLYSFKNLRAQYGHWQKHHIPFRSEPNRIEEWQKSHVPVYNFSLHPHEFVTKYSHVTANMFQVQLSSNLEYVIDDFKKANGNFPMLRNGEEEKNSAITTIYSPYIINFDNFILGEDTFVPEYEQLMKSCDLPTHLDAALTLYRDWYIERGINTACRQQT
jgi:hypothetical protein